MLYDEAAVRANVRNRDGKRVFFLCQKDTVTPSARDWLQSQRIEIRPGGEAKINEYMMPDGETRIRMNLISRMSGARWWASIARITWAT